MTKFNKSEMTERESHLFTTMSNHLADYMIEHKTERGELMAWVSLVCTTLFIKETEIDAFCDYWRQIHDLP